MKKLVIGALAVAAMLFGGHKASAQMGMPQIPAAPVDSAVIVGHLDNGLTYYIRHNEQPKGQADFFIAQKVGSILEDDNQRGLAHFLEHMCFNGTKNFPGNSLIDWLATVGVKFGYNLNAYTGLDETVYNISSVPVQREGVIDSCLLILHDWADDLLLDPEEINKERGVIHEEWRRSNVGQMRILEQLLPTVYPNNNWGKRLPIGTMEVVDNFEPQALRDYYEKWYRPDNQAIIVVGDIDPVYVENKIKEMFSPIKMPENAAERFYLPVEDTPGTIYAIGKDKEMSMAVAMLMFKQPMQMLPRAIRNTQAYFGINYVIRMVDAMMNERFDDMSNKPDCPFAQAGMSIDDFFVSSTKDAVTLQVVGKGNDIKPAFEAAYRELQRAAKTGFTQSEYDRVRTEFLANLEKEYEQRAGRDNTSYAREYAANFTKNDPIPGIGYELEQYKAISQQISVEVLNAILPQMISSPDNRVLLAMFPETETYQIPTEADFANIIEAVEGEELEGYKEDVKAEPLIEQEPVAVKGTVTDDAQWNCKLITYPNGAKVYVKPTEFKKGEILFDATAIGGVADIEAPAADVQFLPYAMFNHGLGTYNSNDMKKYLTGKQTSVASSIDEYMRTLLGSTTPKNLQTLMELIYMNFRGYNITADDFASMQNQIEAVLANQEATPEFQSEARAAKYFYKAPAKELISTQSVKAANRENIVAMIQEFFNNPADFNFVFVGDIDMNTFLPLADKYIGSIPASRIAGVKYHTNPDFEPTVGSGTEVQTMKMETPTTYVAIMSTAKVPYTSKNRVVASIVGQVLSKRLLAKIREEMGAVYSIGAVSNLSRLDAQNFVLQIPFPMKPEKKNEVLAEINKMMANMESDITADELNPIKEYMVKNATEAKEKNDNWKNAISGWSMNGVDTFNGSIDVINSVTLDDVMKFWKEVMGQNNTKTFVLENAE